MAQQAGFQTGGADGGGGGGGQKGVVYQTFTLSPKNIIAHENCTPLCQE